jgi:bifunctional UDP-N-acetylglucosamine pyrophosphorylase / glucosamine-1-phosphate N-acetyltransferase
MNSDLPKVLHEVADRPMVQWVVDACEAVGCDRIICVVGHQSSLVRNALADRNRCEFVEQAEQLGTGHAVEQARELFVDAAGDADVLVLCGDGPLIRAETLRTLIDTHHRSNAAATLATATIDDPSSYGRIIRDSAGRFERIVEEKDATVAEREIREINPSYYCFNARRLFEMLKLIDSDNAKGEYYITDVFTLLLERGERVEVVDAVPPEDVLSINTPEHLAEVDGILRARHASRNRQNAEVTR